MSQHVIISGCSGGGKSTLLEALSQRGEAVVEEPGRRIVTEELKGDGQSLPWVDPVSFARRAVELSLRDRRQARPGAAWVFFDRGLIDAAVALEHMTGEPVEHFLSGQPRFYRLVFLAPPWPEIYQCDAQRRHGLGQAVAEYDRLAAAYPRLGYTVQLLPKASVDECPHDGYRARSGGLTTDPLQRFPNQGTVDLRSTRGVRLKDREHRARQIAPYATLGCISKKARLNIFMNSAKPSESQRGFQTRL